MVTSTSSGICTVYSNIKIALNNFKASHNSHPPNDDDILAMSNLFGPALRLAWHDAGETNINAPDLLGPDGCLSSSSDNAGLVEATSVVYTFIEPLWQVRTTGASRRSSLIAYIPAKLR